MNRDNNEQSDIAMACHRINRATKSLGVAVAVVRNSFVDGMDIAECLYHGHAVMDLGSYGLHEADVVDGIGREYGYELGCRWKMEQWLIDHAIYVNRIPWTHEDGSVEYFDVRSEKGVIYGTQTLKGLVQTIMREKDYFYELKHRVLYIACGKGELTTGVPQKTKWGWAYCMYWDGIPFHIPCTRDDNEKYEHMYGDDLYRRFSKDRVNLHDEYERKKLNDDIDLLRKYISVNRKWLSGYDNFKSAQVF